ncbi:TolC family protein [Flavobacterium agricola]|uniref:TolC family protein n=1 Tax=Flavobacterium agricola TaxID=2870839 RepID=A0ABY6LYT9_9FLAO|nr:TolC family protein [Flavobacterium agricola]UYW00325.1 TolC family protein [Flavobacterium agricola]
MAYFNTCFKFGFGVIAALALTPNANAQSLSFTDAYNQMYNENSSLKAVHKQDEAVKFTAKSFKGLRYPSINAYALGVAFDRSLGFDLNPIRNGAAGLLQLPNPDVLGDWQVPITKKEMAFAGFNALWPIFTGGKINAAVKAGAIESEIAEKDVVGTQNRLITELAERYFQVKLADEAFLVRKQVLKGMEKHLYDATKLEENGIIAPVEKLLANVAVSEANREVLAAEKDKALARVALANTLEMNGIDETLTTDFFTAIDVQPLDFYKKSAIENFPELQKIALQKDLADQGVKLKQAIYYPNVVAFGQTTLLHNDPIGLGLLDSSKQRPWMVGVGVTYNLFSGLKGQNELKAAKATRESVDFLEAKAKKDVATLVEKVYQALQKSEDEISNLKVQEELATELLRVRNLAFIEGLATTTDVVDAENNLSGVKLLILNAKFAYTVSLATLLELSGQSNEFLKYTN